MCGGTVKAVPHLDRPATAYHGSPRPSILGRRLSACERISIRRQLYALPLPTSPFPGIPARDRRAFQDWPPVKGRGDPARPYGQ
ncbi:hypothetical protein CGRA01v4_00744 [Colletotrichum graminicola]|nr:hypothetical protein CGRA01v4_00744 [Colletotrichum graminicola]